jgi:enamine deaminase RidA (YjgF/YER057c/UK114 family)
MINRIGVKPTYSESVTYNGTVYLSGQVPWATAGKPISSQAKEVFELIDMQLAAAGTDKTRILSLQIFLTNPGDYADMNKVFTEWIPSGTAPARNTICGVKFPTAGWSIEVVVVAATS